MDHYRPLSIHSTQSRRRRVRAFLAAIALASLATLGLADPAAAVTRAEKLVVLADWTQPTLASYQAWNAARANPQTWSAYAWDWSTDGCTASPDTPLGFDFRLSCRRHDFGYRNYTAVGTFPANKARLDNAFYADLRRRCGTYHAAIRPACLSLAWTYYQAVKIFGSVAAVTEADLQRAGRLKSAGQRAARS